MEEEGYDSSGDGTRTTVCAMEAEDCTETDRDRETKREREKTPSSDRPEDRKGTN